MSEPAGAPLKKTRCTPLTSRSARAWCRLAGWDMPVEYSRHPRRAPGRAHRGRPLRCLAHGRDRDRRQGCARGGAAHLQQRRVASCRSTRRTTPALTTPDGHVRRRHARLSLRAQPLPARRQRQQRRQGLRLDRRARQGRRATSRSSTPATGTRSSRCRGRKRADRADADGDRPVGHQVLLVRARREWRACAARSRAPATPARTASRSSCRRAWRRACGTR